VERSKLVPQYGALSDEELAIAIEGWDYHLKELQKAMHTIAKSFKLATQQVGRMKLVQQHRQSLKKVGVPDAS
jgi:hypothetical protein